jgi:two-component system, OmpR family, phosphate regulon sensor histidine kinase PhoR
MKKNFPIIFILITISLAGIIYIQVNWILTMVENKQALLKHKLVDVMSDVGQQLVEERASSETGFRLATF